MRHLVFTVYAPLGSWGSASQSSATTAVKPTETTPTRSALTGLLGAAIGAQRRELPELAARLALAWRTDRAPRPQPAPDFQIVSKGLPPSPQRERWTRLEEVRAAERRGSAGYLLSRREYFADGLWTVAVTTAGGEAENRDGLLDRLCAGLRQPVYALHIGRRCFPLGLPPDPAVVEAETLADALAAHPPRWERDRTLAALLKPLLGRPADELAEGPGEQTPGGSVPLAWDEGYPGAPEPRRRVRRQDVPAFVEHPDGTLVRLFSPRTECQTTL